MKFYSFDLNVKNKEFYKVLDNLLGENHKKYKGKNMNIQTFWIKIIQITILSKLNEI